jgi:7,8-dihydro-6-hydroxymethylpterin-pyrophosphokinase
LAERAFALIPLCEIAPEAMEPRRGKTAAQLLESLLEDSSNAAGAVVRLQSHAWVSR